MAFKSDFSIKKKDIYWDKELKYSITTWQALSWITNHAHWNGIPLSHPQGGNIIQLFTFTMVLLLERSNIHWAQKWILLLKFNHRIYRGKSKNCFITWILWNLWFRYAYVAFKYWGDVTTIHSDDIIRGSYGVIFFGPTVPIGEGGNFHSCNNF